IGETLHTWKRPRMSSDRVRRLSAHIARRRQDDYKRPEQWIVEQLNGMDLTELSAFILNTLDYTLSQPRSDWWHTVNALSEPFNRDGKRFYEEEEEVSRKRAGNCLLNYAYEEFPELYRPVGKEHEPQFVPGAETLLLLPPPDGRNEPAITPPPAWDQH